MPFLPQFLGLGTSSEYAGFHTPRLLLLLWNPVMLKCSSSYLLIKLMSLLCCEHVQKLRDVSYKYKQEGFCTTVEGEKRHNSSRNRYKDIVPCQWHRFHSLFWLHSSLIDWFRNLRGAVVDCWSLTGELSLSCARSKTPLTLSVTSCQSVSQSDGSAAYISSVVTIASEPVSIDYDRSFEKNRDVDVDSMLHGHVDLTISRSVPTNGYK